MRSTSFWRQLRGLWQLVERVEALEAAQQEHAQLVGEKLDDRVNQLDRLYAKVHSALGRLYRLKGWDDRDEPQQPAEPTEGTRPKLADVMAAKFKR